MKKLLFALLSVAAISTVLTACSQKDESAPTASTTSAPASTTETVLKVAASPVPHAEILQVAKSLLQKEGIDLQIVQMTDYVRPNIALAEKDVDANFTQHKPYLDNFVQKHKMQLTPVVNIHVEPMGVYSNKVKSLSEVPDGGLVTIPNDVSNGGRALLLLQKAGLIKLKADTGISATVRDIVDNPKHLKITPIDAPQLPRTLNDATLAVINTNFALEAKLVPTKDALFIEEKDSPYANILVVRTGDEHREAIQKLKQAMTSPEVKKFIEGKYQGAIIPAF
ncbi:methionine ABC transporter substrate-binding protein [Snodgrassella alvi]|jgi:D-methionine transport system substrate-binding protein|uniref:Lipoprotein n=1 Tax=Snodgrassella alvi TaxID=1196083 RepID=A0A2N9XDL2_9NEIS|nr:MULTISPECIES: MetQ/NlpA family ABC transporter substrate-binding protein [Snodgrassella]PIT10794.1 methionine ABC transporter substrate-binding protein [Snodgrassella communis]PIT24204.1 methionine ABC transporter substrate-binding protein [Snodgrassella communis]PIT45318.1 methionine ABC transporter substrate-binding protein [Snodgrassella alvi]PIT47326.1 methionine ABC transporter substrate-binding protein [Snodgrassella alvi]PIT48397.1 methionine ABC transporter substrate-binding protein